ncbi:MAG: hypothetical protein JW934_13670 [Anaerolineae bacterium]|nr:hypothetical protein [Anaerolineae bacterium]
MPRLRLGRARHKADAARQFSVLDLGASAVKALIVEVHKGRATVLGRGRVQHCNGLNDQGYVGDLDALIQACEEALRDAEDATERVREIKIVPDVALIAVPTAWTCGAMGVGGIERAMFETPISLDECAEPLARAGRRALRNLGRLTSEGTWQLIDATLITFSVNGNPVTEPVGFRGRELQAAVFVAAARGDQMAVLPKIADALQLEPPQLVVEPLALAATLPGSGLLVQVGAGTTQVVLARESAPLAIGHIAHGSSLWSRALIDVFRLSPERADALLRAHCDGKLAARVRDSVGQTLRPLWDQWFEALTGEMRRWDVDRLEWTPEIYLCGGASAAPDIRERLAKAPWLDLVPFRRTPEVRTWDGANLDLLADLAEPRWPLDGVTALSVAAWGVRERGPNTPDGMLRKALEIV